jgi:hypothetical protein
MPPVSPEFGLRSQNVHWKLSAPFCAVGRRYCTSVRSHVWSVVDCSVVPNSPSQTGAMLLLNR